LVEDSAPPIAQNTHTHAQHTRQTHATASKQVGFGKAEATLVVALLCLSVSVCAYPLGRLDDKHGPRWAALEIKL
jgi:hypothetical protein